MTWQTSLILCQFLYELNPIILVTEEKGLVVVPKMSRRYFKKVHFSTDFFYRLTKEFQFCCVYLSFQRHFAVFNLPTPTAESLFTIVTSVLEVSTVFLLVCL